MHHCSLFPCASFLKLQDSACLSLDSTWPKQLPNNGWESALPLGYRLLGAGGVATCEITQVSGPCWRGPCASGAQPRAGELLVVVALSSERCRKTQVIGSTQKICRESDQQDASEKLLATAPTSCKSNYLLEQETRASVFHQER